ncbi:hypothetical protein J437_LFUL012540 [Ladona fulva]|uniref:Uncharacterized protein n=1 Tax=Ladona fulva TaxID=123851 RepID=A0A8K0KF80_LADFU|nr:hypothetical protein J437_LFUL012540 [Ladona fulva]
MSDPTVKYVNRVLELKGACGSLTLIQKFVGDTSCVVWDASVVLAKYLEMESIRRENRTWLDKKVVVELGAGVGCAGLAAACYGARVVLTDLPKVVPHLWANVDVNRMIWDANSGRVEVKELTWGKDRATALPASDVVLMADCVYYDQSLQPLVSTLEDITSYDTDVLICQEIRDSSNQQEIWDQFLKLLKGKFEFEKIPISEQHPQFSSADIILLKAKKISWSRSKHNS